ncbi:MAG TPA: hypothetical protein VHO73_05325 [Methylomirabilota bacterium]|nr:hypothetical protein [Methylomirabilota bacterium]
MLALAAVNVLGAVVFAGVYAVGSRARVAPAALLVGLLLAFLGVTAIWVRVEQRSRALDPFRRVGRGAMGLLAVVIGLPVVVLMPLFWLESQLPLEAVPALHLGPVMALLLVALASIVAVNAAAAVVTLALTVGRRWRAHGAPRG